ncbi:unnamed protein product [Strongylus vulgaris]|uniref:Cytochrome c oxidase assembly factor 3 n=1 Tax=Strongylus vulgaris TaxID=40348 RepID=A0A3P7L012_STRVU|nr:unnamed protein product [Strongylus vulgaris]
MQAFVVLTVGVIHKKKCIGDFVSSVENRTFLFQVNQERVKEIFAKNYKNHIAFGVLISVVVGIYYYTIHAVKQETFLEEIDEEMAAEHPQTHGHLHVEEKK